MKTLYLTALAGLLFLAYSQGSEKAAAQTATSEPAASVASN
ncbi:hypothetical protein [Solirubrum puertoriconensis]|nr:hypothetical protein [Solirubrum puertoriconensis]